MTITGTTTISIKPSAVSISDFCSIPTCPLGLISAMSQPLSKLAVASSSKAPKPLFTSKSLMQCPHLLKAYWYKKMQHFIASDRHVNNMKN